MDVQKLTVLYVDDDPVMLAIVRIFLERNNAVCKTVASVIEAFEVLRFLTPDLILSDYEMPEVSGNMFRRSLLSDERLSRVPFMFFSSFHPLWLQQECTNLGVRAISKDAGMRALLEEIRQEVSKSIRNPEGAVVVPLVGLEMLN